MVIEVWNREELHVFVRILVYVWEDWRICLWRQNIDFWLPFTNMSEVQSFQLILAWFISTDNRKNLNLKLIMNNE